MTEPFNPVHYIPIYSYSNGYYDVFTAMSLYTRVLLTSTNYDYVCPSVREEIR